MGAVGDPFGLPSCVTVSGYLVAAVMIHPDTTLAYMSDAVGFGVVATKPIPAGTIVWAPDPLDRRYSPAEVTRLPAMVRAQLQHFAYLDHVGNWVLAWDHGRYVNHSCVPTCVSGGWDCNVAAVDLAPGDELTDDYGSYVGETFRCRCGCANCRGSVGLVRDSALIAQWDARFAVLAPLLTRVPQPLWSLLDVATRTDITAVAAGTSAAPSISRLLGFCSDIH